MPFYQASICRNDEGHYFVAHTSEVGNPLKIRVDQFDNGMGVVRVLRLPITREDWLTCYVPWKVVDPRELTQRYNEHCKRERTRLSALGVC